MQMIEQGKISAGQMTILAYPTIIATAILLVPALSGEHAHQDVWLSPIWGALPGFITLLVIYQLHTYYPNQTFIQYCGEILGKIPGKMIGGIFLLYIWHLTSTVIRQYGEFVVGSFLPKTPMVVVLGSMALVCALAVRGGLEVMARSAQVFIPVIVLLFIFILILLIPDLDLENMFPIMENGIFPSLKGAISPGAWYSEIFLLAFMLPYLGKGEKGLKWGIIAIIVIMITLVMTNLFTYLLFGNITSSFIYPVMDAARYISAADFLQHLESIVMAIWVTGAFIKISVLLYVLIIGTAQWLQLSDYKPIVFPMTFLVVIGGISFYSNLPELAHYVGRSGTILTYIILLILPMILLLISFIRRKVMQQKE